MIAIRTVQGEFSAYLIKSRLDWAGIPALIQIDTYFNLILPGHVPVTIYVPFEFEGVARELAADTSYDLITTIPKKSLWTYNVFRLLVYLLGGG